MSKSKKPPADEPTYFLDECLGQKKVYEILKNSGLSVERSIDHFPSGTEDTEWLPWVGKKGWVLITKDKMIRRRKHELAALKASKVKALFISAKELRGEEIGELIVNAQPKIKRALKKHKPPLIAVINRSNVVEIALGQRTNLKK